MVGPIVMQFVELTIKIVQYCLAMSRGLLDIVTNKEDIILDRDGNVVTKLPGKREQMFIFAKEFIKEPKMVASLFPSSQFMADKLLSPIDWDKARVIVEYGPGIGNISQEILRRMHPDCKLVLFELNAGLAEFLQTAYTDPRLIALERSAADVEDALNERDLGKADYVISGVPFSHLPPAVGKQIVDATRNVLNDEGKFLVYQFRPNVLELLAPRFAHIDKDYEIVNIPPLRIYSAYN